MKRRQFIRYIATTSAALFGVAGVGVALDEAEAARRGYQGPVPTCSPGWRKDCNFGCQCYCIPENVCGTACCNPAAQTCEVVGVDPETGDPVFGCVAIPE
jgi:hypothetical protein